MKEQLINKDTAILAKEKGFDWNARFAYVKEKQEIKLEELRYFDGDGSGLTNNNDIEDHYFGDYPDDSTELPRVITPTKTIPIKGVCAVPSQSLLQKWLRDVHNIHIEMCFSWSTVNKYYFMIYPNTEQPYTYESSNYPTYEEALEQALIEALNLINNER